MSVVINARGTSVSTFTIGKQGITFNQGSTTPATANNGDFWFNQSTNTLSTWNGTNWVAPTLGAYHPLTWPTTSGSSGQVLSTNGSGNLSWVSSSSLPISYVVITGTTALSGGYVYICDMTSGSYSVVLPASPSFGETIKFIDRTGLWQYNNLIVSANGSKILGTSGTTLTGVSIVGTAGQFSCTASSSTLYVGQPLTISGTLGGTGSIVGYSNPTTYYIIATNGSTTFQLSTTLAGTGVTTTTGTPSGLTYNAAANLVANISYRSFALVYDNSTNGWIIDV